MVQSAIRRHIPLLVLLLAPAALGAAPGAASGAKDPYARFVSACFEAFKQSQGGAAEGLGRLICECTGPESISQGVSIAQLSSQAARIRKDPKYRIQDPKLLAAFQYCTLKAAEKTEGR